MELLTQLNMREEYFRVLAEENALKTYLPLPRSPFCKEEVIVVQIQLLHLFIRLPCEISKMAIATSSSFFSLSFYPRFFFYFKRQHTQILFHITHTHKQMCMYFQLLSFPRRQTFSNSLTLSIPVQNLKTKEKVKTIEMEGSSGENAK